MPTITDLDVTLALKGWDKLKQQLERTQKLTEQAEKGFKKMIGAADNRSPLENLLSMARIGVETLVTRIQRIGAVSNIAFGIGVASLLGFVRAGMQGTVEGERLSYRMELLSREIASTFLPLIRSVNDYLAQAVRWFQGLNQEQQANVRKWTLIALGVLGVVATLPKLIAAAQLGMSALSMLYANPVLAGLALLAAGFALVAFQAGRAQENIEKTKEAVERFKKGDITEREFKEHGADVEKYRSIKDPEERKRELQKEIDEEEARIQELKKKPGQQGLGRRFGQGLRQAFVGESENKQWFEEAAQRRKRQEVLKRLQEEAASGKQFQPKKDPDEERLKLQRSVPIQFHGLGDAWRQGQMESLKEEAKRAGLGLDPTQIAKDQLTVQGEIRDGIKSLRPAVV